MEIHYLCTQIVKNKVKDEEKTKKIDAFGHK